MLHSYSATNFQSFLDRVEVSLCVNRRVPQTDWFAGSEDERVSKVLGAIGANGSGKTALLKPVAFLGWFFSSSFQQSQPGSAIPVHPHFAHVDHPVEIECVFEQAGSLWRYTLRCTPQRVLHEALYRKQKNFRYVFIRDWVHAKGGYDIKQQDFGLDPHIAAQVRPNVSLIAWGAQYGIPIALQLASQVVYSNVGVTGRLQMGDAAMLEAAQRFMSNESQRAQMERLLCSWDLGLSGIDIRQEVSNNPLLPQAATKVFVPYGRHRSHGSEFNLHFMLESNGTRSAFNLLSYLLPVLSVGGLAVMDEFESDLHPHMLDAVLSLFASPHTNPYNAQLLFTTHSFEVLNTLDKTQIMLVEKNEQCESQAVRLDHVHGVRSDVSLYSKYMAGAFGAVPHL